MKTTPHFAPHVLSLACGLALSLILGSAQAQTVSTTRATELRQDKLASAEVIAPVASGAQVRIVSIEGGWVLVESAGRQGWVRASTLNMQAAASAVSGADSGRQATGSTVNAALTLGVRSLPARSNRHALIIGIGTYADPQVPPLPGTKVDKESATQMANAMQVPSGNIKYLQDSEATGDNIRKALADLNARVQEGDRVFIHYSGHGTRYPAADGSGCVEALLAYDGGQKGMITNKEMSGLLTPITQKTDKIFVMYDACHSGGVISASSPLRTRGLLNNNDEGPLRPKFSNISEDCGRPVNMKTRNLLVEQVDNRAALPQDVIHVSASKHDEISFDDGDKGGLATQFMRDCMLRDARDRDGSGAISIEEIKQCAQEKLDKRMRNDPVFKPHNIQLSGNTGFVPAWFAQALPVAAPVATVASLAPVPVSVPTPAPVPTPVAATPAPVAVAPSPAPVATPAPAAPALAPALSGEQALRQMYDQRDAKRRVAVSLPKQQLKIGQDVLEMSVMSDKPGFVYVAMAGSDNKSLYMLFPNDLDQNNRIEAGKPLFLPRPNWRARAGGPEGKDSLLIIVSDGPRDLASLAKNAANKAGPFVTSLNNSQGRAELGSLMSVSTTVSSQECSTPALRRNNPLCSDAYGAAMVFVDEVK